MGPEHLRIAERRFSREMIFERDFSLHVSSRNGRCCAGDYARTRDGLPAPTEIGLQP
jgi:hypothetical protein